MPILSTKVVHAKNIELKGERRRNMDKFKEEDEVVRIRKDGFELGSASVGRYDFASTAPKFTCQI